MQLPARILFVGAHCDDLELCAGGLLARACYARLARVGVLVFSDHRGVLDAARAAQALGEFRANLRWLEAQTGVTTLRDHTGPAEGLLRACRGEFEAERGRIYAALEALRDQYDLVVTHSPRDTNQDHQQVAAEAARVFKAHASLWGGEFPNNDLGGFHPQVYVALGARELDAKIQLLERYRSQRFGGRPYLDADVTRSLARVRGSQIREDAAEAFEVLGRIVVRAG